MKLCSTKGKAITRCMLITVAVGLSLCLNLYSLQRPMLYATHLVLWAFIMLLAMRQFLNSRKDEDLRRAQEAAERADRAKNHFLVNVSHEVRTPLNGVMGMVDLLLETPLSAEQLAMANTIKDAGANLLDVMNDLLSFSKMESGNLRLESENFHLASCISKLVHNMRHETERKRIELRLHIDENLPEYVNGDADKLSRVVSGLLSNAVKFTEAGHVELRVDILSKDDIRVKLRVSISDTGIGIAQDKQDKMFVAFEQEDSSATRKYGGIGLGLPISSKLLNLMGSTLTIESSLGKGSRFCFELDMPYVSASDEHVLNLDMLKQAVGGDNELLKKTVALFISSAPELWAQILASVEAGDNSALKYKAQSLKSYLTFFTKGELFDLCSKLEALGQSQALPIDKAAVEAVLHSTKRRLDRLMDECKEISC